MISLCYLHIGTEKTGTTTIQQYLAKNRGALLAQGVLFPRTPGEANHVALTLCSMVASPPSQLQIRYGIRTLGDVAAYRAKIVDRLRSEASKSGASAVILSNEHLSMKLTTHEAILRIRELCDGIADTTRVIVYLRNQADFLASRYTTAIKAGSTDDFTISLGPKAAAFLDYSRMLAPWREIFGRENMAVHRFEPDDFPKGDLLEDFAMLAGLDHSRLESVGSVNVALTGPSLAFLREFNKRVPLFIAEKKNPLRGKIANLLEKCIDGDLFSIPKDAAEAIEAKFRESNNRTSREFFGSRFVPLFSPPRCVNNGNASNDVIGPEQAVTIAAHLWSAQQREINELKSLENDRKRPASKTGTTAKPDAHYGEGTP